MAKVVELKGSHYEIGLGWGAAFKGEMDRVAEMELGGISQFFSLDKDAVVALGRKYLPAASRFDPDFMEVLKGFAKGADMEFDTLFAIRTVLEILFFTGPPQGMCTSFAVTGKATKDGQTILGQNIDWHPGLPAVLLKIHWPNGTRQLSLSLGGIWEYPLSAHPSARPYGLVSTLTATPDETPDIPMVPVSIIMNKALRQKNPDQALAVFTGADTNLASFILADADGHMKGVELGLNSFEPLTPEDDVLVHANHYVSARFAAKDIFLPYVPDSPLRHERLEKLIKQNHGELTPQVMMTFLADHENYPKGICAHVDPESDLPPTATLASVIMVPQEEAMYVCIGNPCENGYIPYDLPK